MPILFAVLYNLAAPYWDTLKKSLAQRQISSLTILHAPNIVGHPLGLLIVLGFGFFSIPTDISFFSYWFGMVLIASMSLTLNIWGLRDANFFSIQVLSKLGFVPTTLLAVLILGERLSPIQITSLFIAIAGVICFAWPDGKRYGVFKWDKGIVYKICSLILSGFASIFYKIATFHTPDYTTFLTGRFIGDLVGWTVVWVVGLVLINRVSPARELFRILRDRSGLIMLFGVAAATLLSSWLIYVLPVSTFAMLGILTLPASYLWSRYKYTEVLTGRMWLGSLLIITSVILFLQV